MDTQRPSKSPGPTAIGLLIRMYTGWDHYDPRLQRGVAFLASEGPSKTDMYFNYYATQVMHHYGGPHWPDWNRRDARLPGAIAGHAWDTNGAVGSSTTRMASKVDGCTRPPCAR